MKKLYILLLAVMSCFMFNSCYVGSYATTQDDIYSDSYDGIVRSDVDVNLVIRYGTPYYYEGDILYYLYNGIYYYPYYYNNYWYFRSYSRPWPHYGMRPHFRPHRYDYRFYRGFTGHRGWYNRGTYNHHGSGTRHHGGHHGGHHGSAYGNHNGNHNGHHGGVGRGAHNNGSTGIRKHNSVTPQRGTQTRPGTGRTAPRSYGSGRLTSRPGNSVGRSSSRPSRPSTPRTSAPTRSRNSQISRPSRQAPRSFSMGNSNRPVVI